MSRTRKIGMELKLQQRWEFRRNSNDSDSSSSDSKSMIEPALKKHRLVCNLDTVDNDETSDKTRLQKRGSNSSGDANPAKSGEPEKRQRGRRKTVARKEKKKGSPVQKKKASPRKRVNPEKCKSGIYEQSALDDLKNHMHSLLEDLKVSRENLLTWMREEMQKLAAEETFPESERKESNIEGEKVQLQQQDKSEGNFYYFQKNNYEKCSSVQQENKCKKGVHLQNLTNLEENNEAHQKNFPENLNLQRYNPFRSYLKSQGWKVGPSEGVGIVKRSTESNNVSQSFDQKVDYCKAIVPFRPSEKSKSNSQTSSSNQNVQVQQRSSIVLGIRAQNCNVGSSQSSAKKGKRTTDSSNRGSVSESQVENTQAMASLASSDKGKEEKLELAIEPFLSSDSYNSQFPSSMYLTLPSVLTKPQVPSTSFDTCSFNSTLAGVYGNKTIGSSERSSLILGPTSHSGYFQGTRPEERSRNVTSTSFRDSNYFNQTSTMPSLSGNGFPVPLHQPANGSLGIPSQVGLENLLRGNNRPGGADTWMNGGGMRFPGANYSLPEHYIGSNLFNHSYYTADGRLIPIQDNFQFPK